MTPDARTVTCDRYPHLPVQDAPWRRNSKTHLHWGGPQSFLCDGRLTASMPGGGGT